MWYCLDPPKDVLINIDTENQKKHRAWAENAQQSQRKFISFCDVVDISVDNLVLSTWLPDNVIRDSKAEVPNVSPSPRIDSLRLRANARNVSFRISLRWSIHIVNPLDKTKLSCNTPPPTQQHSFFRNFRTYSLYSFDMDLASFSYHALGK